MVTKASNELKLIASLRRVLVIVLLVYAAWLASQLTWHIVAPASLQPLVLSSSGSALGERESRRRYPLAQMDLFGRQVAVVQDTPRQAVEEAQKTTLRLRLVGVFTAEQGKESGAIVEELGKTAEYYRIGDTLPGNATLESVYADRILMRRNGRLEVLSFDDEKTAGGLVASQPVARQPAQYTAPQVAQQIHTPEQFIQEATRQLAEDPERALGSVGLAPAASGGYVYQGNNPMLSGLNLQKGDVIQSVNGHSLGDIQKDKSLMQTLYQQGNLEVEVVRNGTSFFINYPLR